MTKNALTILDVVNNSFDHPTAEDIFLKLKAKNSKMVLATVYNNLNMLCEKGLVRRLSIDGISDRFDHINRHDHLYCSQCGKIADIELDDLTEMIEKNWEQRCCRITCRLTTSVPNAANSPNRSLPCSLQIRLQHRTNRHAVRETLIKDSASAFLVSPNHRKAAFAF